MKDRVLVACLHAFAVAVALSGCAHGQTVDQKKPLPLEQMRMLATVYDLLDRSLATPKTPEDLMLGAIRGMVSSADPDGGAFYTAEEWKAAGEEAQDSLDNNLGLRTTIQGDSLVVLASLDGSPAAAAGLKPRDVVLQIDDLAVSQVGPRKVQLQLRGAVGTKAQLSVRRNGSPGPLQFVLERRAVSEPRVQISRPQASIAVLRIPSFYQEALADAASLLSEEWKRRPFNGLILDLRRNAGGVLEPAIGVASLFLPQDAEVASSVERKQTKRMVAAKASYLRSGQADPIPGVPEKARQTPLVILVDEGTAAGAEIVAGALQDHHRATLVGRTTFGHGRIHVFVPVGTGHLRFTVGRWQTPSGRIIDKQGLAPDVTVESSAPAQELARALTVLAASGAR